MWALPLRPRSQIWLGRDLLLRCRRLRTSQQENGPSNEVPYTPPGILPELHQSRESWSPPFGATWQSPVAGSYALQAVAYDNSGDLTQSTPVSLTVGSVAQSSAAAASLAVSAAPSRIYRGSFATFRITRKTASTAQDLIVNYTLGGNAIAGSDYANNQAGQIAIPAGNTSALLSFPTYRRSAAPSKTTVSFAFATGDYKASTKPATVTLYR